MKLGGFQQQFGNGVLEIVFPGTTSNGLVWLNDVPEIRCCYDSENGHTLSVRRLNGPCKPCASGIMKNTHSIDRSIPRKGNLGLPLRRSCFEPLHRADGIRDKVGRPFRVCRSGEPLAQNKRDKECQSEARVHGDGVLDLCGQEARRTGSPFAFVVGRRCCAAKIFSAVRKRSPTESQYRERAGACEGGRLPRRASLASDRLRPRRYPCSSGDSSARGKGGRRFMQDSSVRVGEAPPSRLHCHR